MQGFHHKMLWKSEAGKVETEETTLGKHLPTRTASFFSKALDCGWNLKSSEHSPLFVPTFGLTGPGGVKAQR